MAQDQFAPIAPTQPRARGALSLSARLSRGRSRIGDLRQQGSLKALFPHGSCAALNAVFLNTAGGVTGGDRYRIEARAEAGATLSLTSQAAERLYRAQPGEVGKLSARLTVEAGAALDWLPQETIMFDNADFARVIEADVAPDGRLLAVEPIVFGRTAMGETVQAGRVMDRWRVRRDGALVFADQTRIGGPVHDILQNPGVMNGCGAMAAILLVAPGAEDFTDRLRRILGPGAGCSAIRPGVLFARILATDGFALRQSLIPAIRLLSGSEIPRPWML